MNQRIDITIDGPVGRVAVTVRGAGEAVVLVHGYPQTRRCWDEAGELLAERFQVISFDLRGYGGSAKPPAGRLGEGYSKREMAADVLAVLDHFGLERAHLVGHDRGGRLAYRCALDHPHRFHSLTVLDILPTVEQFERLSGASALGTYHWWFLAQPGGLPERLINAEAEFYLRHCIASWWGRSTPMDEDDLAHYVAAFTPAAVVGSCADYRAGYHLDVPIDRADRDAGRTIELPTLVVHGDIGGIGTGRNAPQRIRAVWAPWAPDLRLAQIADSGHFLAEEQPAAVAACLASFFAEIATAPAVDVRPG